MREYTTNGLLLATSLALIWFFGCIWVEGSHYIQEPNSIILIAETASIAAIFGFAIYNFIRFIKRFTGSRGLSNYVGVSSFNSSHIVVYISGGKALTLVEASAVAEIVAKATGRDTNLIFGVDTDPRLGDSVQTAVVATGIRKEAEHVPSCLDEFEMTKTGKEFRPLACLVQGPFGSLKSGRPNSVLILAPSEDNQMLSLKHLPG